MLNFVHQLDEPIHVVPSRVDDQYVVDEHDPNDDPSDGRYDVRHDGVDNEQLRSWLPIVFDKERKRFIEQTRHKNSVDQPLV